jgi:hypothetical protein
MFFKWTIPDFLTEGEEVLQGGTSIGPHLYRGSGFRLFNIDNLRMKYSIELKRLPIINLRL